MQQSHGLVPCWAPLFCSSFYLRGSVCNTGIHQQFLARSLLSPWCVSSLFLLRSPCTSMQPKSTGHKNNRDHSLLHSSGQQETSHICCLGKLRVGNAIPTHNSLLDSPPKQLVRPPPTLDFPRTIHTALQASSVVQARIFCYSCLQEMYFDPCFPHKDLL